MRQELFNIRLLVVLLAISLAVPNVKGADPFVVEPAKKVPVFDEVDVVVAGGGIAGTIAAITAARHGAKTLVIERFGSLGGNMGPGMFGGGSVHYAIKTAEGGDDADALVNKMGPGGVPEEFLKRIIFARPQADRYTEAMKQELESLHMNVYGVRVGAAGLLPNGKMTPGYGIDSLATSYVAFKMLEEAGVHMLLSAYAADPIMKDHQVAGLFVETKSGRLAVKAKVVIDATGEADVAFRAGAPMLNRDPNCGLTFTIRGIDWKKYERQGQPKEADGFRFIRPIPNYPEAGINIRISESNDDTVFGLTGGGAVGIDFSDAKQVTLVEREHRIHIFEYAAFMRKHAPGFENSYLLMVAPYLGARGGRTINPEQRVTSDDVQASREFDDVIYRFYDDRAQKSCEVPYRIMLPKKIDGLLAAGRSGLFYGPNLRMRWSTMLDAQAAGIAAALCAAEGVRPRELDVKKLQRKLVDAGCPLATEERLKELGLN